MYNPTFGISALKEHILKRDFKKIPDLKSQKTQSRILSQAVAIGNNGFSNLNIQINNLAGNTIYQLADFPSELVLRKADQNIRRISSSNQSNRINIVRCLRLLCQEGMPFCIAKFDIRKFYESINQSHLQCMLNRRFSTSPCTRRVLLSFLHHCNAQGIVGLPRGLAISATLSELYINDFDENIQRVLCTQFYARYVDDIVMLLSPLQNLTQLRKDVAFTLPVGLSLNEKKTKLLEFDHTRRQTNSVIQEFEYLGFLFSVSHLYKCNNDGRLYRKVTLDIAQSKINKRKTRVVKSLLQFLSDHNFNDLVDRFKIITCNYHYYDHKKNIQRLAGNFYSYGLIDTPSNALHELDLFVARILLSPNGKICGQLSRTLSKSEKQKLLQFSFRKGFERKTHFNFSPQRLKHLIQCWKYV